MENEIRNFINDIFDIDQKTEYYFHELHGFTFVIKEEFSMIHGQVSSAQLEPIGIIYEENDEFYFAPLDKVDKIDAIVEDDQLSLAIGRHGQNVRLASQLLGWGIDVMSEDQSSEKRQKDVKERTEKFISALDIDDVIAHLLVVEGFSSIEEIAYVSIDELKSIEGFDEDLATELQNRAKAFVEKQQKEFEVESKKMGIDNTLASFEGLTPDMVLKLGQNGVKTLDDLADLASDELVEILGKDVMSEKDAEKIIMDARAHWFENK